MKILFIASEYHPSTLGGIQTFGRALKNMFKEQLYFVSYVVNEKSKVHNIDNCFELGKSFVCFKILNKLSFGKFGNISLKKFLMKQSFQVCLLNSPQDLKVLKNVKCKKILIQHTQLDRYFESKLYYSKDKKLLEDSKNEVDFFIATSEKDKEKWIEEYEFPKEKIKVIRHSCNIDIVLKKKKKNKSLIMVSRLDNRIKRFDLVIDAMSRLPEYTLKIYGDGPDKDFIQNLIRDKKLKNVILLGATDNIEVVLDNSDIFVMTSDVEGYPISTIEAMRRGLPIIIRNTFEGATDIIQNNGVLLDKEWNVEKFCEGIYQIYKNYEYYSENSIRLGKRHDLNVIKEEWKELMEKFNENKN